MKDGRSLAPRDVAAYSRITGVELSRNGPELILLGGGSVRLIRLLPCANNLKFLRIRYLSDAYGLDAQAVKPSLNGKLQRAVCWPGSAPCHATRGRTLVRKRQGDPVG